MLVWKYKLSSVVPFLFSFSTVYSFILKTVTKLPFFEFESMFKHSITFRMSYFKVCLIFSKKMFAFKAIILFIGRIKLPDATLTHAKIWNITFKVSEDKKPKKAHMETNLKINSYHLRVQKKKSYPLQNLVKYIFSQIFRVWCNLTHYFPPRNGIFCCIFVDILKHAPGPKLDIIVP